MKLREPYFLENIGRDQPYMSMLLIAPYCNFSCEGCQNRHLAEGKIKDFSIEELIMEYNSNPFYQGITVGGLEIFNSGNDFIDDILYFIEKCEIENITIYTKYTMDNFKVKILIELIKNISTVKNFYLKTGEFKLREKNENTI